MRGLLDVNVLIALLDQDHALHQRAREWFRDNARAGWSSCPLTQNGCVRIMAHPGYPNAVPVALVMARLSEAVKDSHHEFWPDDVSLLDERIVDATRVHGPRQITDLYLLALAVRRGGTFVTFDQAIATNAIHGAARRHLTLL
ncbi:MAG: TA system VapC family ribonuclease toxin [Casimicrobiaceae bacterium]